MTQSTISIYINAEIARETKELGVNRSEICNEALRLEIMRRKFVEGSDESTELVHARWLAYSAKMQTDVAELQEVCKKFQTPAKSAFDTQKNEVSFREKCLAFSTNYGKTWEETIALAEKWRGN